MRAAYGRRRTERSIALLVLVRCSCRCLQARSTKAVRPVSRPCECFAVLVQLCAITLVTIDGQFYPGTLALRHIARQESRSTAVWASSSLFLFLTEEESLLWDSCVSPPGAGALPLSWPRLGSSCVLAALGVSSKRAGEEPERVLND